MDDRETTRSCRSPYAAPYYDPDAEGDITSNVSADTNGGTFYGDDEDDGYYDTYHRDDNKKVKTVLIALVALVMVVVGVIVFLLIKKKTDDGNDTTNDAETVAEAEVGRADAGVSDGLSIATVVPVETVAAVQNSGLAPLPTTRPAAASAPSTAVSPAAATTTADCPVILAPGKTYMVGFNTIQHDGLNLCTGPGNIKPNGPYDRIVIVPEGATVEYTGQRSGNYILVNYFATGTPLSGWIWTRYLAEDTTGRSVRDPYLAVAQPTARLTQPTATPTQPTATPTQPTTRPTTAAPTAPAPRSESEIVAYFRDAYAKIAYDARSATHEWENISNSPAVFEVGSFNSALARPVINKILGERQPYEQLAPTNVPPKGMSVCALDLGNVRSATCTDNGSTLEIRIKLNSTQSAPERNPYAGSSGVGSVTNVLDVNGVTDLVGDYITFRSADIDYFETEIIAKIERSTQHIKQIYTKSPSIITLTGVEIKALTVSASIDEARLGLTIEHRYTVDY